MSENPPSADDTRVSPRVLTQVIHGARHFAGVFGAQPVSKRDEGIFSEFANVPDSAFVGEVSRAEGALGEISYEVFINFLDDPIGLIEDRDEDIITGIHISANERPDEVDGPKRPETGGLNGWIFLGASGSVSADFDHGTGPCTDPENQRDLVRLAAYFGVDEANIISPQGGLLYDDERATRLAEGLRSFGHEQPPQSATDSGSQ